MEKGVFLEKLVDQGSFGTLQLDGKLNSDAIQKKKRPIWTPYDKVMTV